MLLLIFKGNEEQSYWEFGGLDINCFNLSVLAWIRLTKCLSPGKLHILLYKEGIGLALASCKNQTNTIKLFFISVEQDRDYTTAQTDGFFFSCDSGGFQVNQALADRFFP